MDNINNDNVEELIAKSLAGEASADEQQNVLRWRAVRPENEQQYRDLKKIFDAATGHFVLDKNVSANISVDDEWEYFVNLVKTKDTPVISISSRITPVWMKIAAAILVLITAGFVISYFVLKNRGVMFSTKDKSLAIALPDGSHVTLNAHSELSYAQGYGEKNRILQLTGEAFFEVKHDAKNQFIVEVGHTTIEDLGTSFNIRSYPDEDDVEVIVQTGIVKFSALEVNLDVNLTAGQKGTYSKNIRHLNETINNDPNFLSWNTRKIEFVETDLKTVIETLNKTYNAHISFSGDVPPSCSLTVTFDHQTLESVLNVLKTTLNLTIKITGDKIEITHAEC